MRMTEKKNIIYLVGEGTGETVTKLANAALSQFSPNSTEVRLFTMVEDTARILSILSGARRDKALVAYTIVDAQKRDFLEREAVKRGVEAVEKAVMSAGTIEMAFLEKNLIWLSTIIGMAPMLGFTGTVWGMIDAFDSIKQANDISPSIVAGGISQALLTTLFGLVVAMIIQICNNYFISRIDKLVIEMEESSVDFIDTLSELEGKKE